MTACLGHDTFALATVMVTQQMLKVERKVISGSKCYTYIVICAFTYEKIAFESLSQRQNVIHTVMWGLEAAACSQLTC